MVMFPINILHDNPITQFIIQIFLSLSLPDFFFWGTEC